MQFLARDKRGKSVFHIVKETSLSEVSAATLVYQIFSESCT